MRNIDLKFDTFQLTVLQEPFLQFMHFSSFQFPFCLDISLVTGIFDAWYNAFRVRYFLILLFENFSSVHTIHSVIHIKNLSITIISSPSLKPHILQILSLTISLHLASPLLSPRHMHTVSCIFCYTHRWTGLFSVEPIYTPCWFHKCLLKIQTLLFLKKKKKTLTSSDIQILSPLTQFSVRHQLPSLILKSVQITDLPQSAVISLIYTYTLFIPYADFPNRSKHSLLRFFPQNWVRRIFLFFLHLCVANSQSYFQVYPHSHPSVAFPDLLLYPCQQYDFLFYN